jgi:hypothetical protein
MPPGRGQQMRAVPLLPGPRWERGIPSRPGARAGLSVQQQWVGTGGPPVSTRFRNAHGCRRDPHRVVHEASVFVEWSCPQQVRCHAWCGVPWRGVKTDAGSAAQAGAPSARRRCVIPRLLCPCQRLPLSSWSQSASRRPRCHQVHGAEQVSLPPQRELWGLGSRRRTWVG